MAEINIPGINEETGLELYGGDTDIYISVMKSFILNTPVSIRKLQDISQENLPNYAITIHGLKSVLATIAAEELSERARNLETLAKENNLPGIRALNADFISDTEILIDEIKKWLETSDNIE